MRELFLFKRLVVVTFAMVAITGCHRHKDGVGWGFTATGQGQDLTSIGATAYAVPPVPTPVPAIAGHEQLEKGNARHVADQASQPEPILPGLLSPAPNPTPTPAPVPAGANQPAWYNGFLP